MTTPIPPHIKIDKKFNGTLDISVETPRLVLSSLTPQDKEACIALLSDRESTAKYYATQGQNDPQRIQVTVEEYLEYRQRENPSDALRKGKFLQLDRPFTALAIKLKSGEFIGMLCLDYSLRSEGALQLSLIVHKNYWDNHYGSEALTAVVQHLAPALKAHGYKTSFYDSEAVRMLEANVRTDNTASNTIVRKTGMRCLGRIHGSNGENFRYQKHIPLPDPEKSWEIYVSHDGWTTHEK